jgi:hypothetical protein
VAAAVGHVDTTLCAGLDTLVTVVLALKDTTPALCASTKEAAVTYASQITTYLASFTLAQVVLKASDLGLETVDSMFKLANFENCAPVVEGMKAEEIVEKRPRRSSRRRRRRWSRRPKRWSRRSRMWRPKRG